MILAEKVALLRKKKGWSQEELAERLGISRQSVSKWESGASIPDIDKIIMLSKLFQVSTDYLLKDEMEEIGNVVQEDESAEELPKKRSVSLEEANSYMALTKKLAAPMAFVVALFVCCPIPLLLLAGMSEFGRIALAEGLAGGIGVTVLLVIVAIGVAVLILCGTRLEHYNFLEKEVFTLQYGVEGIVKKNKELFAKCYNINVAVGVVICIIGAVPLLISASVEADDFAMICCFALLLAMVAVAVFLFVRVGMIQDSFHKLLQSEGFTPEQKIASKKLAAFSGAYWCIVTIVFLVVYFYYKYYFFSEKPMHHINLVLGMIWLVGGVLYAAIRIVLNDVVGKKEKKG